MRREDLEHIIRASAGNADTKEIVVIGSQSILGSVPNPPEELCDSMEADVFPRANPAQSILIDGAIGEGSVFHETFGYYAHGVGPETAVLPKGAFDRLVPVQNENTNGAIGWCLEVHDLAVSKLVAGREKDLAFVNAMVKHGIAKPEIIRERLSTVDQAAENAALIEARLKRIEQAQALPAPGSSGSGDYPNGGIGGK